MNCCVNVVSASFQQFPVNNCNNKLLRRPSGKSQIHPNFANNSIVNITTEKQITTPRSSLLSFTTFALHRYHIINTTAGNSYNTGQQRQQINATIIIWQGIPLSPVWKFTSYFFTLKALLALTGALIVMVVYHISVATATFSDFHSVHWCNWCYKCHSESLKQYQCNWCHKMKIDAYWMSNGPMFQWSNVPMCFSFHRVARVSLVHWSIDPLVHWSIGPLVHWSISPLVH